jgi:hypothetical protein
VDGCSADQAEPSLQRMQDERSVAVKPFAAQLRRVPHVSILRRGFVGAHILPARLFCAPGCESLESVTLLTFRDFGVASGKAVEINELTNQCF